MGDARHYPLRRIVGHTRTGGDALECGHEFPEASDIYGQRPSGERRRCGRCWREMPEAERKAVLARARAESKRRKDKAWKEQAEWIERMRRGEIKF